MSIENGSNNEKTKKGRKKTSPFGQRTFATRPPSKAEDMGLSQGSFVSFLEERVKEVFTSIHVSVESTKPAEVYTTDTAES